MTHYDDTANEAPEYAAFVDKFKPKKTTDDCYTPNEIYDAVRDWAVREYRLEGRHIMRPFWPGGDYQSEDYSDRPVVIDNPPFSIISQIVRWYMSYDIDFFLFAPALTLFSTAAGEANYVVADCDIVYENGARVRTGFVTNLGEYKISVSPELHDICENAKKQAMRSLPKYSYPDNVISGAILGRLCKGGIPLQIRSEDCHFIRKLDAQQGTGIYGGAFLLSERAAAERAAAERAAAERAAAECAAYQKWQLSERERTIIAKLGSDG